MDPLALGPEALIEWWRKASAEDRDAAVLIAVEGWRWESLPCQGYGRCALLVPPQDSEYKPTNYPRREAEPCGWDLERFTDWDTNPVHRRTRERGVPEVSRSLDLVAAIEAKVIGKVGLDGWTLALFWAVTGRKVDNFGGLPYIGSLARASASDRALACLLAIAEGK